MTMNRPQLFLASFASLTLTIPALAIETSDFIPVSQAVGTAQLQVAGSDTPIKIDL